MSLKSLSVNLLPDPLSLRKLIGPSFILLALGLGSGEVILWPYLSANYGLGIIWGALLGITFQFFINMEIERYALAHGESIFVGLSRKLKLISFWFLISTFIPWMWPGIIASSAKFLGTIIGIGDSHYLAIVLLILIGVILSLGPILYKTLEVFQKTIILIGVPSIFILSFILAKPQDLTALFLGTVGVGEGFLFLPAGISIATFLAALAYAGAGGNLNLAQSFYIKEKGYGMGKYAGRITSLLTGKSEEISITGTKFEETAENTKRFNLWWRNINIEHFLIFWLTGSITILLLSLLSYSAVFGQPGIEQGVNFIIHEARFIGERIFPAVGTFFLLIVSLTLFGTQLGVFDATSRILSENVILGAFGRLKEKNIRPLYYLVLWLQIIAGIIILLLGFTEPLQLVIIAAVLNAIAMFVHTGLVLWLNMTSLEKSIRPSFFRIGVMALAFLFYGGFSLYVIYAQFLSIK
ncbi:MAG: Nramp family divalent metal transporter [Candidatus Levybacteria bacterium]|nr:Nramp family divalent metal transporter [Candidatus Levybacteria bacterium]